MREALFVLSIMAIELVIGLIVFRSKLKINDDKDDNDDEKDNNENK